ncbi:MAG: ABC transporter permease [Deltaproteobacteria bacterium]|nr:ABC transporter permease [Deltaproteobacteria bacterium]
MKNIIENIGSSTIGMISSFYHTITFAILITFKMFDRKTYNSATLSVITAQIYYTSVEILPLFICVSVILGTLVMGILLDTIKALGLDQYLGTILMGFAVNELSPFVTVLLLALRSGSAINTEIAVMKVNRELDTLQAFNIDENNYLFIPRIISVMISLVLLTGLFSIVLLTSGVLFSNILFGMGLNTYSMLLVNSIEFSDMTILFFKCLTFGFFITLIPILSGMRATYELTSIPVSVLHGMIRVFIAIIMIEVLSLLARFL